MNRFWDTAQYAPEVAFVQDDGRSLTYLQATRDADSLAQHLGATKRIVFILCGNDLESVVAYLACLRSGHVPLLLNAGIEEALLENLCHLYRPHFIWSKSRGLGCATYGSYALESTEYGDDAAIYPDLALLLTTSGSTGSPKLVRLSYENLRSNAESIAQYLGLTPSERAITVLPMNYSYGLSVINSHLHAGARLLLTNASIVQKPFWEFFRTQEATSLTGVPYTYAMYQRIGLLRMDLPSLRYMTQAGGKLQADKVGVFGEWARTRGIRFFVMYGQTEATARMSYLPPDRVIEKNAAVGLAIPGGRFSITDSDGREITESGLDGELVYSGPNVFLGYASDRADLQKGDEIGGVLRTGDMARYDEDRYVYITGRTKRFIKVAGNRVGLDDLETLFRADAIEALCGGTDDLLCVAVRQHDDVARAQQLLSGKLQFHHTMYKVITVAEAPRNEAGKIQYQRLFQELLNA